MGNTKSKSCELDDDSWIEDEEMLVDRNKKFVYSQSPSMWQYNPKEGMPTELANLDSTTFLTSREGQILCSLPRDILARICSMLSAWDFVDLSSTCRFLHWRMFTFCTCYASFAAMEINDDMLTDFWKRRFAKPKSTYILNNGAIYDLGDPNGFRYTFNNDPNNAAGIRKYPRKLDGQRGLFVYQAFSLRRPFLFDTLELKLNLPFYDKQYYDRCLPYIMAIRGLVRDLNVIFVNHYSFPEAPFLDFRDTNDFLATINASFYDIERLEPAGEGNDQLINLDIYINCPYARQMKRVMVFHKYRPDLINVSVFENSIATYGFPLDTTVIATLKNFLSGSTNLIYHKYICIEKRNGRFPLLEYYLFEEFGEFEEYFLAEKGNGECLYFHVWKKVVAMENGGGLLRIVIKKLIHEGSAHMRIGKDEMFDQMDSQYTGRPLSRDGNTWWKMETALEPLDEPEEPGEVEKSGKVNEIEVEQEVSPSCLSVNSKCSIQ